MHFGFAELEEFDVFGAYLMLALQFDGVGALLEVGARVRLVYVPVDGRLVLLLLLFLLRLRLFPLSSRGMPDGLRVHDLELFL